FLSLSELPRRLDDHLHKKIAAASAPQARHALSGNLHNLGRLDAALERVRDSAVQRRGLDLASQRRLAEGDRHRADKAVAVALEKGVLPEADGTIKVTARPAPIAGLPLATEADARASVDTRRDGDID